MTFIVPFSSSFFLLCMHVILQRVHGSVYEFLPRCRVFFLVVVYQYFEAW